MARPQTRGPAPRRLGRRIALGVAALLTVAVGWLLAHEGHVALPSRGATVDAATGHIILTKEARDALGVDAAEVVREPLPDAVPAYATLEAPWRRHAFASSRLSGKVVRLHVRPGQVVEAGEVLAEVASQELEALQAELLNLQSDERLARKRVEMLEAGGGSIAETTLLDARNNLDQAKNAGVVGRARWRGLGLDEKALDELLASGGARRVAALPVRSPIGGTVIHADLSVGRVVEPGEHLFEVVDLSRVWARLAVLEADIDRVRVGQEVELSLTAYPGEVFRTRVGSLGLAIDPRTHVLSAWAELENPAGEPRLLPGMSGQGRILLPPRETRTWTVPAAALLDDGVERYVLVEEAATEAVSEYRKRPVVVVGRAGDRVEVRAKDLYPGDRVVARGAHELGGFFIPGVLRPGPEAAAAWGLSTAPAGAHAVDDVVEVEGHVDIPPDRRAATSTQLAGNVVRLHVERGQAVTVGQLVAEVASQEFLALQLDLLRESLALGLVEQQYQRQQKLVGVAPQRRLVELEAQRTTGRNRVDALRNRLAALGMTPDELTALADGGKVAEALPVRAPIAGRVVDFARVVGQAVRPDEPLVEVHDLSRPLIVGFVTERDLARLRPGLPARVRLTSSPDEAVPATVVRSGRVFVAADQTLSVWARPEPPAGLVLRHRQLARVSLVVATRPPALAVPLRAVAFEGGQPYVFVSPPGRFEVAGLAAGLPAGLAGRAAADKSGGTFERRPVTLGRTDDRFAEVATGLRPGEVVAVAGVAGLQTAFASVR